MYNILDDIGASIGIVIISLSLLYVVSALTIIEELLPLMSISGAKNNELFSAGDSTVSCEVNVFTFIILNLFLFLSII